MPTQVSQGAWWDETSLIQALRQRLLQIVSLDTNTIVCMPSMAGALCKMVDISTTSGYSKKDWQVYLVWRSQEYRNQTNRIFNTGIVEIDLEDLITE